MEPFSTLLYLPHLGLIGRSSMSWLNQARESPSFTEHYVFLLLISLPTNKKRTLKVLCVFSRLSNGESPKPNPSCADGRRWSKSDGTRTRWFWFESNETESTISFDILLAPKPPLYRTQGGAYINGLTWKRTNLPNVNMSKRRVYPGTHHLTTPKHCMHLHLAYHGLSPNRTSRRDVLLGTEKRAESPKTHHLLSSNPLRGLYQSGGA